MFKRILVAVDGSHMADQALQEAIKLAREMQAKLRIVHAVDTVNINLDTEFFERATMSDVAIEFGQKTLRNAEAVAKKSGIATETHLIEIDTLGHRIAEVIASDADAWSADLIVLCTEVEVALGEMCHVVKETYGDEAGGFIAGQVFQHDGFISNEGSIDSMKVPDHVVAVVTYWSSFEQHEKSHADKTFNEKFKALSEMCSASTELRFSMLWQGVPGE